MISTISADAIRASHSPSSDGSTGPENPAPLPSTGRGGAATSALARSAAAGSEAIAGARGAIADPDAAGAPLPAPLAATLPDPEPTALPDPEPAAIVVDPCVVEAPSAAFPVGSELSPSARPHPSRSDTTSQQATGGLRSIGPSCRDPQWWANASPSYRAGVRPRALGWLGIPALLGAAALVRVAISNPAAAPGDRAAAGTPGGGATGPTAGSGRGQGGSRPDSSGEDPRGAGPAATTSATAGADSAAAGDGTNATSTAGERPRVTATSPSGVRVALDAPVVVKFDRAPDREAVALTFEPPAAGRIAWPDAQTLAFTPARWADGKPYHARVEGAGVETATFDFRTLFPPPERVEPGHGGRITLTFDDGADKPAHVTALLDLLQKEDIQALFFPTGRWAEAHPRLVERMIQDGHSVCNHTYSHQNLRLPQLTDEEIRTEIRRGASDGKCRLFRPPLKAFDPRVERIVSELDLTLYLWDVDSRDWEGAAAEDIVNLVLARAHPGAVVLFHMHQEASLQALPRILPRLRKAGYVFRDTPPAPDAAAP